MRFCMQHIGRLVNGGAENLTGNPNTHLFTMFFGSLAKIVNYPRDDSDTR